MTEDQRLEEAAMGVSVAASYELRRQFPAIAKVRVMDERLKHLRRLFVMWDKDDVACAKPLPKLLWKHRLEHIREIVEAEY